MTGPNYDLCKLASPPEAPACTNCGHDYGEHLDEDGYVCYVGGCSCERYDDEPPERDPDEAYDRRYE